MKLLVSFFIFLSLSLTAKAQLGLEGFSSGRYEKRSAPVKSRGLASEEAPVVTDSDGVKVRTLKKSELEAEKAAKEAELAKTAEAKKPEAPVVATVVPEAVTKPAPETETEVQEPSIGDQAQRLFSNKTEELHEFYRESIHPDDIRNNRAEIEVMPAMLYNDAKSNYSYRNYQSYFNALKFRANVWLTPLIGVSGQMLFSFAADVDAVGSSSRVPAKYEMVDLGINFRKFFGVSRKSNSVEFSVLLSDNKMTVPSDNTSRARLKSQGLGVGLKARIPTSASYAWIVGGSFFPRLQHSEDETGVKVHSGSSEESVRLGVDLGGEWKFTRQSQMIWSVGISSEKNTFDGVAALPDPGTGATPSNVSVSSSLVMFSLGYRWGH
ncbi:MAG: hypothetical protein HUU57_11795 [Bdellovibrio sp.]|nr:hypothetical protein [Bdellovibrio sp.]